MHLRILLLFTTILGSLHLPAQNDCGCSAALRYDINKLKKDSYSEMLLARDINMENYKDLRQRAGGNVSIFGIEIGGNGENIQQIKNIYQERIRNLNIEREIIDYESITTSPVAYSTYSSCMKDCLNKQSQGVFAYVVAENAKQVIIDVHYAGEPRAEPIIVTYNVNGKLFKTRVKAGEWNAVYVNRPNNEAFDIVFSNSQYKSDPIYVSAYHPITGNFLVTYDEEIETPGPDLIQSAPTLHEENKKELMKIGEKVKQDATNITSLVRQPDGYYAWKEAVSKDGFNATRIGLVISAPPGHFLRIYDNSCVGGCGFTEDGRFLENTTTKAVYTILAYGPSCTFSMKAHTYKLQTVSQQRSSFTTNTLVSLMVPPKTKNTFVHFKDQKLELGMSNASLKFIGPVRVTDGGWRIFDYKILPQKK